MRRGLSGVRVIRNSKNLGFVGGNNVGIAEADPGSDVVLLNNDVEFLQSDWLQRLRACAHETPGAGVVGCRLVLSDGRLLHAGTYILPDTMWAAFGSIEKDVGQSRCAGSRDRLRRRLIRREVIPPSAESPLSSSRNSRTPTTDCAERCGFRPCGAAKVTSPQRHARRPARSAVPAGLQGQPDGFGRSGAALGHGTPRAPLAVIMNFDCMR